MLERFIWDEIRKEICEINPQLSKIIDKISPDNGHAIYRVRYPFGSMILDKRVFHLPNMENEIVPLSHSSIPDKLKNDLNYNGTMPVGMIVKNSIESYLATHNRIVPSTLYNRGGMIALWSILDDGPSYQENAIWNVSSGSRSIFMLPKITDKNCYKTLQNKYSVRLSIPASLYDHWNVFKLLANQTKFSQSWFSEIVFFSKHWFSHKTDSAWDSFNKYLYHMVWQWTAFRRNQFIFDFTFSHIQEKRNLKPNPYLFDTVRHLFAIASGMNPAFSPLVDNSAAPVNALQNIFLEDYGLKHYAPIIMGLRHFSLSENHSVFYSLETPTTMIFSPRSTKASSTMAELRELKHIMEVLIDEIEKSNVGAEKTPLYQLAKSVRYNFYHTEKDKLAEIEQASNLTNISNAFTKTFKDTSEYAFPEFAPFFRGCISISSHPPSQ